MWKKYCTARQVTDDNKTPFMRFACWMPKVTNIHSEYTTGIVSPGNKYTNALLVFLVMSVIHAGLDSST
jgi:hypothetical protein